MTSRFAKPKAAELTEQQRCRIIDMYVSGDMTRREIGNVMGISAEWVAEVLRAAHVDRKDQEWLRL